MNKFLFLFISCFFVEQHIICAMYPLHDASAKGCIDEISRLLEADTCVNREDDHGRIPLHYAISEGNREVVRFLLENGADINHADNTGITPLHLAKPAFYQDMVVLLQAWQQCRNHNSEPNFELTPNNITHSYTSRKIRQKQLVDTILHHTKVQDFIGEPQDLQQEFTDSDDEELPPFLSTCLSLEDAQIHKEHSPKTIWRTLRRSKCLHVCATLGTALGLGLFSSWYLLAI